MFKRYLFRNDICEFESSHPGVRMREETRTRRTRLAASWVTIQPPGESVGYSEGNNELRSQSLTPAAPAILVIFFLSRERSLRQQRSVFPGLMRWLLVPRCRHLEQEGWVAIENVIGPIGRAGFAYLESPGVGMMLHQDASRLAWLFEQRPELDLVVTMDDAPARSTRPFWSRRKAPHRCTIRRRLLRSTRPADSCVFTQV